MRRSVALGVDSGTQSTKVVAVDLDRGTVVAEARAPHTGDAVQAPSSWWEALVACCRQLGAEPVDVRAISVAGQQHGLVTLDAAGAVVRPAPLWNNTAAAADAERLNGLADFAAETGSRLVASFTIAKLAHLARTDPDDFARVAAVCLPHDWLTLRLSGRLATDRGDASGTGWWSPATGTVRRDLLALAVGRVAAERLRVPDVLGPEEGAGHLTPDAAEALGLPAGIAVGPGTGDNMAASLGIGTTGSDLVVSLGTSGTAFAVSDVPTSEPTGAVCGFADATGRFLPLACLINCTGVVDAVARLFGETTSEALDRAAALPPGAGGITMVPYLGGERTPNLPDATGRFDGLTLANLRPELLLRAAVDGVAAGLAYCVGALRDLGISRPRIVLVGGGSRHLAWQQAISDATGLPVSVRSGGEHAARGAAVQAAAIVHGVTVAELVERWQPDIVAEVTPRPGMQEAFRLPERLRLLAATRE